MKLLREYFATARERQAIMLRRQKDPTPPWTKDPIFRQWRFCCVRREDDRQTRWLANNVRPYVSGLRAVEATICYRWFNRTEVAEVLEDLIVDRWDSDEACARLANWQGPVTTGAYMTHTPTGYSKLGGVLQCIDAALSIVPSMVPTWGRSLEAAWRDLQKLPGFGKFMAYEIVSDLRWTDVLSGAEDIMTWASAGPGCARGLGRVVDADVRLYQYGRDQVAMLEVMRKILEESRAYWPQEWPAWEMREVEHWACEFDKYQRAAAGVRLKRRYEWRS